MMGDDWYEFGDWGDLIATDKAGKADKVKS